MNIATIKNELVDFDQQAFDRFLNSIIHQWSRIMAALVYTLVPLFFVLDYFTMPENLLTRFAVYRVASTFVAIGQYFIIKNTRPGKLSIIHGYIVSLVVGGSIAMMTVDLGGFNASYYAGLNLVVIGVNLLLPWRAIHSALNGVLIVAMYILFNFIAGKEFHSHILISNLFFMNATIIIAVSINHVKYKLIRQEFYLRTELSKARDALWGEMTIAKKIQTSLLPSKDKIGSYRIAAKMVPAEEVGGDYYDVIEAQSGEQWIAIGDVSGHGVESGLIMMMTQTSIFSMINANPGIRPSNLLDHVNYVLRTNLSRMNSSRYITITAIRLNKSNIVIAGKHQDMIIYRSKTKSREVVPTKGTWLGLTDDIGDYMEETEVAIDTGDIVLLFTDGATEATNLDGEMFGEERLFMALENYAHLPENEIVERIISDINKFQSFQEDDITIVVVKKL